MSGDGSSAVTDHNAAAIRSGHSADDIYPAAIARAEMAFDLLENGFAATPSA
ncbi:hypothetical protein [Nocardia wallacei]|uniref:hypothetical protein n=1 Tax=Nocardia wallacei TaxID=480035 RepID=UPI0024560337|nr:hypothetical protein [Nocardia wallacei]